MKSFGTFIGALFALSVVAHPASAKELRIYLGCQLDDPKEKIKPEVARYQVVKVSKPESAKEKDAPKWEDSYVLEVYIKNKNIVEVFSLEGISGDEDYNEYKVLATDKDITRTGVSAVTIQNKLEWANLINEDGSSFADCKKK